MAFAFALLALGACSNERLAREGTLSDGDTFREYSRIPYGYERVIYSRDGKVLGRQELHTEQNFKRIQPGMTRAELTDIIGAGFATRGDYADGTHSLTWRYYDGVYKLLHVIFGRDGRVMRYDTEWDPNVYSKKK
ncbi:MAG TPA: hypothetical protein VM183_02335 [Burkholderiales bacterium]|nr:hypothetical protein [Burkholderiales bacterium]